jgi:hypothetical protein
MDDVRQMVAMVVRFEAEDVREIKTGWGRDLSKRQWWSNKRMKLAAWPVTPLA